MLTTEVFSSTDAPLFHFEQKLCSWNFPCAPKIKTHLLRVILRFSTASVDFTRHGSVGFCNDNEWQDVTSYYVDMSAAADDKIAGLRTPTLAVSSLDDPIMTGGGWPSASLKETKDLFVLLTRYALVAGHEFRRVGCSLSCGRFCDNASNWQRRVKRGTDNRSQVDRKRDTGGSGRFSHRSVDDLSYHLCLKSRPPHHDDRWTILLKARIPSRAWARDTGLLKDNPRTLQLKQFSTSHLSLDERSLTQQKRGPCGMADGMVSYPQQMGLDEHDVPRFL